MMFESAGATSFAFADTEQGAIDSAVVRRPDFISSDVTLHEGTGTGAVAVIQRQMGPIPVIFITATPDVCADCGLPRRILLKPLDEHAVCRAFQRRSEQLG
jgi:CheY-like chemotaxis protein